jgi:hypothetical protein
VEGHKFYGTGKGEEPEGKYKGHFDSFWDGVRRWFGALGEDPVCGAILFVEEVFDSYANSLFFLV